MKVAIGADHAGVELKAHLVSELERLGPRGRRPRHAHHRVGRLPADLRGRRARGRRRRGRSRHRARRLGPGRADRGQQGRTASGPPSATTSTPPASAASTTTPTCSSMGGRIVADGPRRPRSSTLWLAHPLRRRPPRAPRRPDRRHRARGEHAHDPTWPSNPDDEVLALIDREVERQNTTLQLIASENFTSPAVLRATGSVLTNKYSEGYPGKRYYGGNEVIDEVEDVARDRAKALFGAEHANVQPHAGANANMAVYLALLEPGDTVLGLRLDQGGHLTHGSPVNASGKLYHFVSYGVRRATSASTSTRCATLAARAPPEDHRHRRHRLPADHRPAAVPRHRRRGRRAVHVRRRPHRRAHRRRAAPEPGGPRRRHHDASPRTRPCAVRAAAHPLHGRARRRRSTSRCSRACRAARSTTSSPPRPSRSREAATPEFRTTPPRSCATPRRSPRAWPARASAWCPAAPTTTSCSSTSAPSTPTSPARRPGSPSTRPASA